MKRALVCLASMTCVVVLSSSATFAAEEAAKPSDCAFVRSIDRWSHIDDETALIWTSPRRKFKVTFNGACRDLKWAIFARLDTRPGTNICLSPGDTLIFGRGALFPSKRWEFEERCMIRTIEGVPLESDAPPADKPT